MYILSTCYAKHRQVFSSTRSQTALRVIHPIVMSQHGGGSQDMYETSAYHKTSCIGRGEYASQIASAAYRIRTKSRCDLYTSF